MGGSHVAWHVWLHVMPGLPRRLEVLGLEVLEKRRRNLDDAYPNRGRILAIIATFQLSNFATVALGTM